MNCINGKLFINPATGNEDLTEPAIYIKIL